MFTGGCGVVILSSGGRCARSIDVICARRSTSSAEARLESPAPSQTKTTLVKCAIAQTEQVSTASTYFYWRELPQDFSFINLTQHGRSGLARRDGKMYDEIFGY